MGDSSPATTDVASVIEITDEAAFDEHLTTADRVLVDFYADWCGPCQMLAPILDEFAAETDASVVKVDVDEAPDIAARFGVQSIPTIIAFHDGVPEHHMVGVQEKQALARAIDD